MFDFPCPRCSNPCSVANGLRCNNCDKVDSARTGITASSLPTGVQEIIRGLDGPVRELNFEHLEENINEAEVTPLLPIETYRNRLIESQDLGQFISSSKFDSSHFSSKEVSRDIDTSIGFRDRENPHNDDAQNESIKRLTENNSGPKRSRLETSSARSGNNSSSDNIQCDIFQYQVMEISERNQIAYEQSHLARRDQDLTHDIIDSEASKKGTVCAVDEDLAVPGPSCIQIKMHKSNISEENSLSSNPSEIQSAENIQRDLNVCNICEKKYAEDEPHEREQTCVVCEEKFQCKTELNEHYFEHLKHFATHCWNCNNHFYNHLKLEEKLYVCCFCGHKTPSIQHLKSHYKSHHRLKYYCKFCQKEYEQAEKSSHDREYTCKPCDKTFQCAILLEDHYIHQKVCLDLHCLICQQKINKHLLEHGQPTFYKCCNCTDFVTDLMSAFKRHLMECSKLRLFKCKACGKRYRHQQSLNSHRRSCPAARNEIR